MKKILFVILTFVSTYGYSQERVNREQPIISKPYASLSMAIGWRQQPNGQWMERNNRIPIKASNGNINLLDFEDFGIGNDNFITLQLHQMTYKNNNYIVLIKKSNSGYYTYSSIREGWQPTYTSYYAIFDLRSFEDAFRNIESDKQNYINIKPKKLGSVMLRHDVSPLEDIVFDITKEGLSNDMYDFVFRIAPYKDKGVVQFLFYDQTDSEYTSYGLFFLSNSDLDKEELNTLYYETEYNIFNSFITLP